MQSRRLKIKLHNSFVFSNWPRFQVIFLSGQFQHLCILPCISSTKYYTFDFRTLREQIYFLGNATRAAFVVFHLFLLLMKWYFVTKIVLTYCEKIVLVIEKNFWNSKLKAENLKKLWDHYRTICSNNETQINFW